VRKFLRSYWVEVLVLLGILIGIFLLVEQFDIRVALRSFFLHSIESLKNAAFNFNAKLKSFFTNLALSDLIGAFLILIAVILLVLRIRHRFSSSEIWRSDTCPRCGSGLQRIHRTPPDRILARTLLPHARRYQCTDTECGWSGLRRHWLDRRLLKQPD